MAEMLLINPRRRRRSGSRKTRTAAQRRATAKLVAMNRRRRRNPMPSSAVVAMNPRRRRRSMSRRRRNPVTMVRSRRSYRRNPAMRFSFQGVIGAIQNALVQGAGAVAFDIAHGQIQRFLPAQLVPTPGRLGLGDLVKAAITVFVGQALSRPTRGLSVKAATGALTVQAHSLIRGFVPSNLPLGYAVPGVVTQGAMRVGPNRGIVGMGRYTQPGATPLLNRYTQPGATPLLNAAAMREGVSIR
jgi:hypothetical protein